ncbi:MAG: hypothetical protein EBR09_07535 [Proteobacteria bacterium]|nr:hypothetical protein [Pseudomonadota bacterium]
MEQHPVRKHSESGKEHAAICHDAHDHPSLIFTNLHILKSVIGAEFMILKKAQGMSRSQDTSVNDSLISDIKSKMSFLKEKGLWEHSVDFSLQRFARQRKLPAKDPLYIQTALNNYMDFHNELGVRLPIHKRNSSATLASEYKTLIAKNV